jgi:hypothetical protein
MYLATRGVSREPTLNRPINGRFLVTWLRAVSGHATAVLPIRDMNSRRLMGLPLAEGCAGMWKNITFRSAEHRPPGLVLCEQLRRRSPARLILEIDIRKLLAGAVDYDKARL